MDVRQPAEAGKAFETLFAAGDLALVHGSWTMAFPDGRTAEGATAEVLRRSTDGTWKFVIDNPDGPALIGHG
jgi:ketosteroid isomerase-like protein